MPLRSVEPAAVDGRSISRACRSEIAKSRPAVETAKQRSDALTAQAARSAPASWSTTAARVQALEEEKGQHRFRNRQSRRTGTNALSQTFVHDRVQVARLLAVLERLQHDMPPVLVLKPDDALGAARGAMLLGASLPRVYGAAAALSRAAGAAAQDASRACRAPRGKRAQRITTRQCAQRTGSTSRDEKPGGRRGVSRAMAISQSKLDSAADEAADLGDRCWPRLRPCGPTFRRAGMVVDCCAKRSAATSAALHFLRPVIGTARADRRRARSGSAALPGVSFLPSPGAQVVAPADSRGAFCRSLP